MQRSRLATLPLHSKPLRVPACTKLQNQGIIQAGLTVVPISHYIKALWRLKADKLAYASPSLVHTLYHKETSAAFHPIQMSKASLRIVAPNQSRNRPRALKIRPFCGVRLDFPVHHDLEVTWSASGLLVTIDFKSGWADLALSLLLWCFTDRESVR